MKEADGSGEHGMQGHDPTSLQAASMLPALDQSGRFSFCRRIHTHAAA